MKVSYRAQLLQSRDHVVCLGAVGRILFQSVSSCIPKSKPSTHLPVNIDSVEAKVFDQICGRRGKCGSSGGSAQGRGEVARISPTADRKKDFELSVSLFQEEELLDASVDIVSGVTPRIARIVLISIRPGVRKVDLSGFRADISKCIENVGESLGRKILGVEVSTVDGL